MREARRGEKNGTAKVSVEGRERRCGKGGGYVGERRY